MAKLPRLKVHRGAFKGTYDFEQAKGLPFGQFVLVVEHYVIGSYEDLFHLMESSEYRNWEFLNVELLDIISGG